MFLEYTNEVEVLNILKSLNAKKGAGADGIRAVDVKNNAECLKTIITSLINSSLSESTVPDILKTSLVRPIFKNGNKKTIIITDPFQYYLFWKRY